MLDTIKPQLLSKSFPPPLFFLYPPLEIAFLQKKDNRRILAKSHIVGWWVAVLGWEAGGDSNLGSRKVGLESGSNTRVHGEGGLGCWSGEKAELSAGGQFEVRNWRGALGGGFGVGGPIV